MERHKISGYTCLVSFGLIIVRASISGLVGMIYMVASLFDLCLIIPLGLLGMIFAFKGRKIKRYGSGAYSPRFWLIFIGVCAAFLDIGALSIIGTCPVPMFLCNPISLETFMVLYLFAIAADAILIIAGVLFQYPNANSGDILKKD